MAETDDFNPNDHANYYALLGVSPGSQPDEITQAFHRLARENHPDLHPGDAAANQRFKDINTAYQTLSDPERRAEYDRQSASALADATVAARGEGPEVITVERSIDLGGNADLQAVVEELRTAVTGMAAEAADEMRKAFLDFGVEVDNIARAAGQATSENNTASPAHGNRAQRRAASPPPHGFAPPHGGVPPHGGQPPKRRPRR